MNNALVFDPELLQRYDLSGPRYTSYPTAVQFHEGFDEGAYRTAVAASNNAARPLSLYLHLPFCGTVCYYCACNKIITANRKRAAPYLNDLHREIELQAAVLTPGREVRQLHWGGGTPTFISDEEMRALMAQLRRNFRFLDNDEGDYSIEIDPREVDPAKIGLLRELGFNRMSFGVQDFDPKVQEAVNRIQTVEETFAAVNAARAHGFKSINIDLIYGLPYQDTDSFAKTLDKVLELSPDRLSVFNYAHMPHLFKVQKQMDADTLPSPGMKLAILQSVIERLTAAGYVYIGMDHFAKPDDELALAQEHGTLYRNFQGYSTHAGCDLVAMGITSIGMVDDTYSQNVKSLEDYHRLVSTGKLPVYRGVALTEDDKLRRAVITELICHFGVDMTALGHAWKIRFADYFADELARLQSMAADGLLTLTDERIQVQPRGRLLIRNICMVFDAYLKAPEAAKRFSRVI